MKKKQKYPHNFFEIQAWKKQLCICGIDEAGRGALAGPVVAGAVILPINTKKDFLKDSKILSKQERDHAYLWITQHCHYAAAISCHKIIDSINIYQATLQTMRKALVQIFTSMPVDPSQVSSVLVDAMPLKLPCTYNSIPVHYFNYGESISSSVAAASIVAKVTRDRIMDTMAHNFPSFEFEQHKGYGTKIHTNLLEQQKQSLVHRKTFLVKLKHKQEAKKQLTLF